MNNSDIIEISELDLNDNFGGSFGQSQKSTNFGGGIELLMNDKIRDAGKPSADIDLEDLNNLENELNNLSDSSSGPPPSSMFNNINKASDSSHDDKPSVRFSDTSASSSKDSTSKTWDGYAQFNNIPINPDKHIPLQPQMSKEELLREKFRYLRKLEALEKKGVELSKKYTMDSPLNEMQGEYETILEEKTRQNSVKFQGNMLMAVINGIEFLNNRFDPFDIKLDGWSEQINENITEYDEIFGELYEKYKSKATMAPELKLLFQLGGSAMMVHMTNTMFKSSVPGMDDIFRQNPDLMRSFQNAAVNSMAGTNPGFSGFMSGMMNPEPQVSRGSGPPPPLATQGPNSMPPSANRAGNNNYGRPDTSMRQSSFSNNDGIDIRENYGSTSEQSSRKRPEMKGPGDISDILSGLKTKTINIQESQSQSRPIGNNDSSTISISDLKDLQADGNFPKRSKRRQKSASNTISLDI
jgi:hypothetical protein